MFGNFVITLVHPLLKNNRSDTVKYENLSCIMTINSYIILYNTINVINTHYIHTVLVQDFVSGRACCVNQYHYELFV